MSIASSLENALGSPVNTGEGPSRQSGTPAGATIDLGAVGLASLATLAAAQLSKAISTSRDWMKHRKGRR
jgi:hypothetical protein